MNRYHLIVPISGQTYVTVEAESEEEAFEKAMSMIDDVDEWSAYEKVIEGNVWYSDYASEIEVSEVEEDIEEDEE